MMDDITSLELKQKLDNGESYVFIDVREPYEYAEYNLGAQLIPLGDLVSKVTELLVHKDDEIVIHCKSGGRSAAAKITLTQLGFTKVRNLLGGVMEYRMIAAE